MSFWSEASPIVKGAVVVGAVGILYLGIAFVGNMAPFGPAAGGEQVTQARGAHGKNAQ